MFKKYERRSSVDKQHLPYRWQCRKLPLKHSATREREFLTWRILDSIVPEKVSKDCIHVSNENCYSHDNLFITNTCILLLHLWQRHLMSLYAGTKNFSKSILIPFEWVQRSIQSVHDFLNACLKFCQRFLTQRSYKLLSQIAFE